MKLKTSPQSAIKLLNGKIQELNTLNFSPEAWKESTIHVIEEIMEFSSSKSSSIRNLQFKKGLPFDAEMDYLSKGKGDAEKILSGLIELIEVQSSEGKDYEKLYNGSINDQKQLSKQNISLEDINTEQRNKIDSLQKEIQKLRDNTVQIDNISLVKLLSAFNKGQ